MMSAIGLTSVILGPRTPPETVSALQQWQQRFPAEQNRKSYSDYDPGYPTTVSPPRRSPPRRSPPRMWSQEQPPSRGPYRSNSPPPPPRLVQIMLAIFVIYETCIHSP